MFAQSAQVGRALLEHWRRCLADQVEWLQKELLSADKPPPVC